MRHPYEDRDEMLVEECLQGSELAWEYFYGRYIGLVRVIVRRKLGTSVRDLEDAAQSVFAALVASLDSYDPGRPLDAFVATVAERVSIQEYRRVTASKRSAATSPVDHHDSGEEGARSIPETSPNQEETLSERELVAVLRRGMATLDRECRKLLRLKYYEERSYKEISSILETPANTLAVRAKRCMDELRARCRRLFRKGSG